MEVKEAIERIKNHTEIHAARQFSFAMKITEALNMAVEALEKQIPKKPNLKNATDYEGNIIDGVYICSECGRTICYEIEGNFKENYPYCNCGQALDWE